MKIKKEFIPFIIGLGIVCLNMPIVIFLYLLNQELIGMFATIIVPLECIMMGGATIYIELKGRKNYKICEGRIKDNKFRFINSKSIKAPVVSYIVDGKNYEITADFGINGIKSFFIKGKKVKVYYKEENPEIALVNNNIFIIVGTFFIMVGIYSFLI